MQQTSEQPNKQLLEGEYGSYGNENGMVVNNRAQPVLYVSAAPNNFGCCAPIPKVFQGIFAGVVILGFLEYLGMIVNELNQADVLILNFNLEEYAWIGWNKLELWSSTRMSLQFV